MRELQRINRVWIGSFSAALCEGSKRVAMKTKAFIILSALAPLIPTTIEFLHLVLVGGLGWAMLWTNEVTAWGVLLSPLAIVSIRYCTSAGEKYVAVLRCRFRQLCTIQSIKLILHTIVSMNRNLHSMPTTIVRPQLDEWWL